MTASISHVAEKLSSGDEEEALDLLLVAWRETRAKEIAALIDALSARFEPHLVVPKGKLEVFQAEWLAIAKRGRSVDLPALLGSLFFTTNRSGNAIVAALAERGHALASWPPDPRLGVQYAKLVTSEAFGAMSKGHQPFWTTIIRVILAHDDPRSIDAFASIDMKKIFKGWNDVARRIAFVQGEVDGLIAALRGRHPDGAPPLPKSFAKDVRAIEQAIRKLGPVSPALSARLASAPSIAATPARTAAPRVDTAARDPRAALSDAVGARGDEETVLAALLEAWRATRSPRIGELVDVISERIDRRVAPLEGTKRVEVQRSWLERATKNGGAPRPADIPLLYRTITRTEHRATDSLDRLRALEGAPADPRAALAIAHTLENITFHSSSTRPFWSAFIAFAVPNADARAADALDGVARRLGTILRAQYTDLSATRTWFGQRIREAASVIREQTRDLPPLDDACAALCDRIAEQISAADAAGARLLAVIHERPDDDGARQVYADHLIERGDPRGELITLQITGADAEREDDLLVRHGEDWVGPLAPALWEPGTRFARGFLDEAWIEGDEAEAIERVIGDPVWSTVRSIVVHDGEIPFMLLEHPIMRALVHVGATDLEPMLALLRRDVVPYTSLGLDHEIGRSVRAQRAFFAAEPKLGALRAIELIGACPSTRARWLLGSKICARLERITVRHSRVALAPWLEALAETSIKTFSLVSSRGDGGWIEFERDAGGEHSARARIGAEVDHQDLVDLLSPLDRPLRSLRVAGPEPKKRERSRLAKHGFERA